MAERLTGSIFAVLLALALLVAGAAFPAAAAGSPKVRTAYNVTYNGSNYHVYANGIKWTKPVGIMYYFDGDLYLPTYSKVEQPKGSVMTGMVARAAQHNLMLVAPVTTSAKTVANSWTWWEKPAANAKWFRGFSDMIEKKIAPAKSREWY